jgi:hypothetical protein
MASNSGPSGEMLEAEMLQQMNRRFAEDHGFISHKSAMLQADVSTFCIMLRALAKHPHNRAEEALSNERCRSKPAALHFALAAQSRRLATNIRTKPFWSVAD